MKPKKLTKEFIENAEKLILMGHYFSSVANHLGICRQTFASWMANGEKSPGTIFGEFYSRVKKAEAGFLMRTFGKIQQIGIDQNNWQALAWCLERRWPEMFAKRDPNALQQTQQDHVVNIMFSGFEEPEPGEQEDIENANGD